MWDLLGRLAGCERGEARSDAEQRDRAVFGPGLDPSGVGVGLRADRADRFWISSAIGDASKPDHLGVGAMPSPERVNTY